MRHQLTTEDRRKGAAVTNAKHAEHGWSQQRMAAKASRDKGRCHIFTAEDRRKGGLATAAKRRAKRAAGLINLLREVSAPEHSPISQQEVETRLSFGAQIQKEVELGPREGTIFSPQELAAAVGAELDAGRTPVIEVASTGKRYLVTETPEPPAPSITSEPGRVWSGKDSRLIRLPLPDPFTLSALKRFRLGPVSPFALTRSQRAHLGIMREGGWIEGSELISLTDKGWEALKAETLEIVKQMGEP